MYPDKLMETHLYATCTPVFTFTANGTTASVLGNIDVYILPERTFAFTLIANLFAAGTVHIKDSNVSAELTFLKADILLGPSMIGQFNVTTLQEVINFLADKGIIPLINQFIEPGIPLPTIDGLTFVNPFLEWGQNYICVSSDIKYVPPSLRTEADVGKVKILN